MEIFDYVEYSFWQRLYESAASVQLAHFDVLLCEYLYFHELIAANSYSTCERSGIALSSRQQVAEYRSPLAEAGAELPPGLDDLPRCPIPPAESSPQYPAVGVFQPHYSEEIRRAPQCGSFSDPDSTLCIQ
jgi:hypothetical protein